MCVSHAHCVRLERTDLDVAHLAIHMILKFVIQGSSTLIGLKTLQAGNSSSF